MWRVVGLNFGAATIGSLASSAVLVLILTAGKPFDDPFMSNAEGLLAFSGVTMFFSVPGSFVIGAKMSAFERRGIMGLKLGARMFLAGALLGGGILGLCTLLLSVASSAPSSGEDLHPAYVFALGLLVGALYGSLTGIAVWWLHYLFRRSATNDL